jgi:hypothetical protein
MADPRIVLTAVDRTKQVFDGVKNNLRGIGSAAQSLTPVIGGIGPVIAATFGGVTIGSMAALVRAQVDLLDGFNDLKDATGASIENISALEGIGERTGTTFDTVGSALVKFNATLKDAGDQSKGAGAIFKDLNLDVEELKRLDPAEALQRTAVALAGFADDGDRARAVQELFGKSTKEIAPFLNDLAEAGELNARVTTEQAAAAEKFNKELFKMQASLTDVTRAAVMPFVSGINQLGDEFARAKKEGDNLLELILKFSPQGLMLRAFGVDMGGMTNGFTEARKEIEAIKKSLAGDTSLTPSERTGLQGKLAQREAQMAGYLNSTAGAGRGLGGYEFPKESLGGKPPPPKPGKTPRDWMGNREWFLAGMTADEIKRELEEEAAAVKRYADTVDDAAKVIGDAWDDEQRAIGAFVQRMQGRDQELDAELYAMSGRAAGRRKDMLLQRLEERRGEFTEAEYDRARKGIEDLGDTTKKAAESATDFGNAFTSALDDVLFRAKDVDDVIGGLARNVGSIGLQKAVTIPLGNKVGDLLSGLLSFDGGGYTGSGSRSGGLDGKGGFLAMLHPQEDVVDRTKGGGGRMLTFAPVTQISVDSRADRAAVLQDIDAVISENNRQWAEQLERMGVTR